MRMKYVVVLCDGMADEPLEELGGMTPLEKAHTPNLDRMAQISEIGMVQTVPDGMAPGSDTANLSVIGYDPKEYYTGRSPLEALSIGVDMAPTDVSFRCNLVTLSEEEERYEDKRILDHSSSEISTEDAAVLMETLMQEMRRGGYEFYTGTSYRHLLIHKFGSVVELTAPHDILTKRIGEYLPQDAVLREMMETSYRILSNHPLNLERKAKGLNPANSVWFWGAGTRPMLTSFEEKYHKKGAMISAVDLLKGIAVGAGLDNIIVEGANGGLHTNYTGKAEAAVDALAAQDYDFVLRCAEQAVNIRHIPKILYHWRAHKDSTAENPESKRYAFEAGIRAIQAHYDRCGIDAEVSAEQLNGIYRSKYRLKEQPLVSVIIPNKDHTEDLDKCIRSIEEKGTYKNIEYIVIENNSQKKETFAYYEKLQAENPKVKVVFWEREFNYSAINNYGVGFAKGEYLLFLNNDTEIINPDCIEELLGYCMRDDVGIVGARLYYEDDTIQHVGVIIGLGGVAGHTFVGEPKDSLGYFGRIVTAQDYSAVTAACLMTKRKVFEKVNGFEEKLAVAFNDVDFCLKVREAGYLVVYNPYAELHHYESKSRGLEDTEEKVLRFQGEIRTFQYRWKEILNEGDPYYSPNLTLDKTDFSLRI